MELAQLGKAGAEILIQPAGIQSTMPLTNSWIMGNSQ